jgi:hypothetical protein
MRSKDPKTFFILFLSFVVFQSAQCLGEIAGPADDWCVDLEIRGFYFGVVI